MLLADLNVSSTVTALQTRPASSKSVETPVRALAEQGQFVESLLITRFAVVHLVTLEIRCLRVDLLHRQLNQLSQKIHANPTPVAPTVRREN
jgi:hypothetical protein